MVEFADGSTIAQARRPTCGCRSRSASPGPTGCPAPPRRCDWTGAPSWTFEPLDDEAFPAVRAGAPGRRAGRHVSGCVQRANEECVDAFLAGRIGFLDIVDTVERVVDEHARGARAAADRPDLAGVLAADAWARRRARELLLGAGTSAARAGEDRPDVPPGRARHRARASLVSIALHEIGHLVPAKLFGVKVTQYMVGFGPTLWSRRAGETEYGIKAIPLGGYIRMIGMFPPAAGRPPALRERAGRLGAAWPSEARAGRRSARSVPGTRDRLFYQRPGAASGSSSCSAARS